MLSRCFVSIGVKTYISVIVTICNIMSNYLITCLKHATVSEKTRKYGLIFCLLKSKPVRPMCRKWHIVLYCNCQSNYFHSGLLRYITTWLVHFWSRDNITWMKSINRLNHKIFLKTELKIVKPKIQFYRPVGRAATRSSLEQEAWGSNLGPVKSNLVLPTARHRNNVSLKGVVLPGHNDAEMGLRKLVTRFGVI